MKHQCIEVGCDVPAIHKVKTNDGKTYHCCEGHKAKWREGVERAENTFFRRFIKFFRRFIKFWH